VGVFFLDSTDVVRICPPSRSGEAQNVFRKDEKLQLLRSLDKIRTYFRENPDAEF
jgi:hypothetical protein